MSHLRPLKAGDPLTDGPHSAAAWSEIVDYAQYADRVRKSGPGKQQGPLFAARTMVLVKNASGVTRDRFNVLGISDSLLSPTTALGQFQSKVALEGTTPSAPGHLGTFVILAQPLKANEIGWAWISGVCVGKVDFDYSDQPYAEIKDGDAGLLVGAEGGMQTLWKESGTGAKWAVIRLGVPYYPILRGKLDGDLDSGGSATMSVWEGATLADSGRDVTINDSSTLPVITSGKKIAGDTAVSATHTSGKWYLNVPGDCEETQ